VRGGGETLAWVQWHDVHDMRILGDGDSFEKVADSNLCIIDCLRCVGDVADWCSC
jgi:hypothetical protein